MSKYIFLLAGIFAIPAFFGFSPKPPQGSLKASIARGEKVYTSVCISCHQAGGTGVPRMNPPLKGTSIVKGDKKVMIGIILNGLKDTDIDGESYSNNMPAQRQLSDADIADVLTYVRNSFGNKASQVLPTEVVAARKNKT